MSDIAVVILAGGEGKRIGGGKPLKTFRGERLIDRALGQARQWSDIVVLAVRERSQVSSVPIDLILDADVPGPLGGLIGGLKFARDLGCSLVLTVPVDMPFLPPDLLDRLRAAMRDPGCALAASGGHLHPVCGLWRAADVDRAQEYAASGRRSLKGLAELLGSVTVQWGTEPVDPFFNVNTSEDLAEAARRGS
jgi:molybdopterin-guanine dinucleotide biosynthesis protein A